MDKENEGWGWMPTSKKKHYFTPSMELFIGAESLCRKWRIRYNDYAGLGGLERGDDDNPKNCVVCRRRKSKGKQGSDRQGVQMRTPNDDRGQEQQDN